MFRQLLLAAAVALMFALVPLEGAYIPTVHSPSVTTESPGGEDSVNTTSDVLRKLLLSRARSDQESPSSADNSSSTVHSRVRRCTEMSVETIERSSENLQERAKCPWTYSYNTDPNRQPQTLLEAQCTDQHLPDLAGQCEHVGYYVPVKRKVRGTWTDQWIWLRVGCTLATPITAPAPPPITRD